MEIAIIIGYISAMLIGVLLGLIGGGGSILTVPVLVYLVGINPVVATAYSLFVVGSASLIGTGAYFRKGLVNVRTAVIFGVPSIVAVYVTRAYLVPNIPEQIVLSTLEFSKDVAIMVLFAVLMIAASFSMIRSKDVCDETKHDEQKFNYPLILIEGLMVGALTGLVGAGGGFLIIPALVVLSKLPMKEAVGTSLLIIAVKSLIGFTGDLGNLEINWNFLLVFTAVAVVGIFVGSKLSNKISASKLKPAFGWFVLIMGIYILGNSLI